MLPVLNKTARWTPAQLSPVIWLDSQDAGTLDIQSGGVAKWFDKSGNARHATQTTSGSRPTYGLRAFNGTLPGLTFDGSNDFLALNLPAVSQPFAFVLAMYAYTSGAGGVLYREGSTYNLVGDNVIGYWRIYAGSNYFNTGVANDTGAALRIDYYNGASSYIGENGTLYNASSDVGSQGVAATSDWYLGSGPGASWTNLTLGEFLIVPSLTTSSRVALEGYLAHKWGFANKLPAAHTYRNNRP